MATALTKAGTATLTLAGSNTYSGGTTVNAGKLVLSDPLALGGGNVNLAGGDLLLDFGGQALGTGADPSEALASWASGMNLAAANRPQDLPVLASLTKILRRPSAPKAAWRKWRRCRNRRRWRCWPAASRRGCSSFGRGGPHPNPLPEGEGDFNAPRSRRSVHGRSTSAAPS